MYVPFPFEGKGLKGGSIRIPRFRIPCFPYALVGSRKALSGHLGQIYFSAGQVSFHSYIPNSQRLKQVV